MTRRRAAWLATVSDSARSYQLLKVRPTWRQRSRPQALPSTLRECACAAVLAAHPRKAQRMPRAPLRSPRHHASAPCDCTRGRASAHGCQQSRGVVAPLSARRRGPDDRRRVGPSAGGGDTNGRHRIRGRAGGSCADCRLLHGASTATCGSSGSAPNSPPVAPPLGGRTGGAAPTTCEAAREAARWQRGRGRRCRSLTCA
mmetsp:Transcript_69606/g.208960  ORF Transcript_69606/g.208960 Transcript_69606/m.208960 type:complete len:200 (-) Transcript_69606:44-643(-)